MSKLLACSIVKHVNSSRMYTLPILARAVKLLLYHRQSDKQNSQPLTSTDLLQPTIPSAIPSTTNDVRRIQFKKYDQIYFRLADVPGQPRKLTFENSGASALPLASALCIREEFKTRINWSELQLHHAKYLSRCVPSGRLLVIRFRKHVSCPVASRKLAEASSSSFLPSFVATANSLNPYIRETLGFLHQTKPWWCSGQHTRSGILSPYARLPKNLILSLSRVGRSQVRILPTVLHFLAISRVAWYFTTCSQCFILRQYCASRYLLRSWHSFCLSVDFTELVRMSSLPAAGFDAALNTLNLYISETLCLLHQKQAVVVQWSAHPTWYPNTLASYARLPKILILSLKGREVVGSNPAHGAQLGSLFLSICLTLSFILRSRQFERSRTWILFRFLYCLFLVNGHCRTAYTAPHLPPPL